MNPTTEDEILIIILNFNTGYDSNAIKLLKYEILKPLAIIFNLSFAWGKMQDSLIVEKFLFICKKMWSFIIHTIVYENEWMGGMEGWFWCHL